MPDSHARRIELEKLTAKLCALFPGADSVKHDAKIRGKSGIVRQIDVLIRKSIGPFDLLIVVDTKLKRGKVRRTDVQNVHDIKEDIGASLAAVVAAHGFDRGAKQFAKTKDIQLLRSIDTRERSWADRLLLPVLIESRILTYWMAEEPPAGSMRGFAQQLAKLRKLRQLPPDIHIHVYTFFETLQGRGGDSASLKVWLKELRRFQYGRMPLRFFGLFAEEKRKFATDGLSTGRVSISEILSKWPIVDDVSSHSNALPLRFLGVMQGIPNGNLIEILIPDGGVEIEICPEGAVIDMEPEVTQLQFKLTFSAGAISPD